MKSIPLNIKTDYELLTSLIKIDDLIKYAINNNLLYLGITDSNMFGTMEFINKCIKNNIKPIIGIDLSFKDFKFILYCKNFNGYINLCKIVSEKNLKELKEETLINNKEDLICVSDIKSYNFLNKIYKDIYINYKNKKEKIDALTLSNNIIFMKESLYINEEDKKYLKYLFLIKEGKTIDEYGYEELEDKSLITEIDSVEYNIILNFIDKIDIKFPKFELSLPIYSDNNEKLLYSLVKKGLYKRLNNKVTDIYINRLKKELKVIKDMGFINYFLIVYDFILYAKRNNIIVGPGRGSAAGSLVSYCLGITQIDPIKYNLIFERFLNKDRITMPDIDIDMDNLRRIEVIDYIRNKYGNLNVANIITFDTLQSKQVLRDVAKVLNISQLEIDNIVKLIKDKETLKSLENNNDFISLINNNYKYRELYNVSKKLEGIKKHTSIHAAGIVISSKELYNYIPLYKSGNTILTGYTMEYLERLGLLKIDLLALKDLTTIEDIRKEIKKEKNIDINLFKIPLDDTKTLKLFHDAETIGIFQFESEGMRSFLNELKVNSFSDIISAIALYRPGPKDNISSFIRRKNGKEKITYIHPLLEPILKDTYGIIIYQEQIIEILKVIGNFSYSEADVIRRAMSKKKEKIISMYRNKFNNGAIKNNISLEISNEIYDLIIKFSNYGFNKSHSVAYSLISFQMAYLKANYMEYFMAKELNLVIGNSIKTKEYIDEARTHNITLNKLDINMSDVYYKVLDNEIIFPFSIIKGIGNDISNIIVKVRNECKFKDIFDTISRLYLSNINKTSIMLLILSGSFDSFKLSRKTMIENLDNILNYSKLLKDLDSSLINKPLLKIFNEYSHEYLMKEEYKLFGFYITSHPVVKYKRSIYINKLKEYFDKYVEVICYIERKKEIITKNKEIMCFLIVSDEYASISAVIFPKIYKINTNIEVGNIIKINGKIEKRRSEYQIIVNRIEILKK